MEVAAIAVRKRWRDDESAHATAVRVNIQRAAVGRRARPDEPAEGATEAIEWKERSEKTTRQDRGGGGCEGIEV